MHYIYILQSISFPDQIYVGCTSNVEDRVSIHNSGKSFHTAKYRPWQLMFYVAVSDQNKAYGFEKYLKSNSGRAFLRKRFLLI